MPNKTHPTDAVARHAFASSRVTRARVAQPRSEVIDEVDGVPSTHTQHEATQQRMVIVEPESRGPLPFAAKQPRIPIAGVAIITLTSAAMAALPSWIITGDATIALGMGPLLIAWCFSIAALALLGHGNPVDRQLRREARNDDDQGDEHDSTAAGTTHADAAKPRGQLVERNRQALPR